MVRFLVDDGGLELKIGFMPRQRRVEYPGTMYHVMSRGDRREIIFLDAVYRHVPP